MEEATNKDTNDTSYLFMRKNRVNDEMQRKFTEKRWVWVPCEKDAYAGGFVVKEDGDMFEVDCGGMIVNVRSCDVFKMNPPKFDMAEDLAELSYLNEPGVLHNLKRRYQNGLIYTYSGLFLLAVNPYRDLKIYGEKDIKKYTLSKKYELEPHIFAVSNEAYNSMLSNRENQSILITGESGAGKTENTKRVVEFLAMVAGYKDVGRSIDRQIIDANPILEAFGNAQTLKNNNSSRFGKFIKIKFNGGNICGAHIEKYLLEKSRVTGQNRDERNYHIFYQLLSCDEQGLKKQLLLEGEAKDYRFLRGSRVKIPDVDDAGEFRRLRESMRVLDVPDEEQLGYFKIVSAILHLGNIEFGEKEGTAEILNIEVAEKVCRLLSISLGEFIKCLIHPVIKAGNEYVTHNRSKEQVVRIVEALARILYDKMFDSVVDRLNKTLSSSYYGNFIGVLDIAGFEIFEQNSFEQLCINYTNEKLQQFFNHHMFVLEQEVYRQEDIDWDFIDFGLDLQPTIDLIEKSNPIGILSYLDEECVMPMATEKTFLDKIVSNIKSNKFGASKLRDSFTLDHYAGNVEYVVGDWLAKNKDPHSDALTSLIQTSGDPNVSRLSLNETSIKKGFFRTVGQKHREQLMSLMRQLNGTNPHFVRCIIPNLEKTGEYLDNFLVLDQLKCNGVLEGIRISRQGFPSRMKYQEFAVRYRILSKDCLCMDEDVCADFKEATKRILGDVRVNASQYRLGRSKVFFRQGILADIEDVRDDKISEVVKDMQGLIRKKLVSRKYNLTQKRMQSILVIQKNARMCCELQRWNWWRLYLKIKPLLDVGKRDNEMKEKDAVIQEYVELLAKEREHGMCLEQELKAMSLAKEVLEKEVENEKRFSAEKDELLMALRYKNDEMSKAFDVSLEEVRNLKKSVLEGEMALSAANRELCRSNEELLRLNKALDEHREIVSEQGVKLKELQGQLVHKSSENKAQIEMLLSENVSEIRKLKEKVMEKNEEIESMSGCIRELEERNNGKDMSLRESEAIIEELRGKCDELSKCRDECEMLRSSYESMQKKLKDEIEDVQLENDRLVEDLRKMSKGYEVSESIQKKLREDLGMEKSRGEKLERTLQSLKAEFADMEKQLQRERQFKDSTQESLFEKIKGLEKRLKCVSDRLKGEEALNRQVVAEKDEMYREITRLQKSKLDEIFEREASFNTVKKSLQMEVQRLEMENQRMNREIIEMKAVSEASEESASATEKFYMMLELESKKRKEVEHQVAEHENRNLMLVTEIESLKEMLELEKKAKEDMMRDKENDMSISKMIDAARKDIEAAMNEMNLVVEGFDDTYHSILDGYRKSFNETQECLLERETAIDELNTKISGMEAELRSVSADCIEAEQTSQELRRQHNELLSKFELLTSKHNALEALLSNKDEEIRKYTEMLDESTVAFGELAERIDQEVNNLQKSDEDRKKCFEKIRESFNLNAANVRKMEETYKSYGEKNAEHILDIERQKVRDLEGSYGQLLERFNDLKNEHQSLMLEKISTSLRLEQLEREILILKENEACASNQSSMYESEIAVLRRCVKFKEEMVASISRDRDPAVIHVLDENKYQALDRKRLFLEHELRKMSDERQKQTALNKQLRREIDSLKDEIKKNRSELLEMRRNLGCKSLLVNRLTRELDEEREMVKFLKPLTVVRRRKS